MPSDQTNLQMARKAILELLAQRDPGRTICPSEAARRLDGADFRTSMPLVLDATRTLIDEGRVEVTQRGEPVDLDGARGPIRLRLTAAPERP